MVQQTCCSIRDVAKNQQARQCQEALWEQTLEAGSGGAGGSGMPARGTMYGSARHAPEACPSSLPVDNATAAASISASMTSLSITEQQGSWIASLSLLGALFGGLCAGVVIRYGRRRTLWLVTAPFSASWFLTMFATCVEMIYVTAFLVGFFSAIIQLATQAGDIFISY